MVQVRHLLRPQHRNTYGTGGGVVFTACSSLTRAGPTRMAQDPPVNRHSQEQEEEAPHQHGLVSTSNGSHKDWLKLGLAGHSCPAHGGDHSPPPPAPPLMPGVPPAACIRPAIAAIPTVAASKPMGDLDLPWPELSPRTAHCGCGGGAQLDGSIRVIWPPPMPAAAAGVWFVLQAARDQRTEPFLPQISRSYLRIRDGRVKVRVLIKYLVNKLELEDESECSYYREEKHGGWQDCNWDLGCNLARKPNRPSRNTPQPLTPSTWLQGTSLPAARRSTALLSDLGSEQYRRRL